jgi:hypothetical protein
MLWHACARIRFRHSISNPHQRHVWQLLSIKLTAAMLTNTAYPDLEVLSEPYMNIFRSEPHFSDPGDNNGRAA